MTRPDEVAERLRDLAKGFDDVYSSILIEAADTIEQMQQRIEADDAAYKELERRQS